MKLIDQVRHTARARHFSYRTEQAYVFWIERFIRYFGIRHPDTMGAPEVEAFLTHLAVDGHVASSTQNQALAARLQRLDSHHGLGGMGESLSQGFNEVERWTRLRRGIFRGARNASTTMRF